MTPADYVQIALKRAGHDVPGAVVLLRGWIAGDSDIRKAFDFEAMYDAALSAMVEKAASELEPA